MGTEIATSLIKKDSCDDYLRIFFKREDAMIWYKLKPYNRSKVIGLLKEKMKE